MTRLLQTSLLFTAAFCTIFSGNTVSMAGDKLEASRKSSVSETSTTFTTDEIQFLAKMNFSEQELLAFYDEGIINEAELIDMLIIYDDLSKGLIVYDDLTKGLSGTDLGSGR